MDRQILLSNMNALARGPEIPDIHYEKIMESHSNIMDPTHQQYIIIEELSELTKELTKSLRGKKDEIGIIEELADVLICAEYIKRIYNISDNAIDLAKKVKIQRIGDEIEKNGEFK